jgi:hypothetical protein
MPLHSELSAQGTYIHSTCTVFDLRVYVSYFNERFFFPLSSFVFSVS